MIDNFFKRTSPWSYIVLGLMGYGIIMGLFLTGKSCGSAGRTSRARGNTSVTGAANSNETRDPQIIEIPKDSSADFTIARPLNGESLTKKDPEKGLSEIYIENNGDTDAIIKLVDVNTGRTYRHSYVHAGRVLELKSIKAGNYWIKFSTGREYSPEKKGFTLEAKFMAFENPTAFQEIPKKDRTLYSILKLTLFPTKGGNVRAREISEEEFADKEDVLT